MNKPPLFEQLKNYYQKHGKVMSAEQFKKIATGYSDLDIHDAVMEFDQYLDGQRIVS